MPLFIYYVTCEFVVKILLRLSNIPGFATALTTREAQYLCRNATWSHTELLHIFNWILTCNPFDGTTDFLCFTVYAACLQGTHPLHSFHSNHLLQLPSTWTNLLFYLSSQSSLTNPTSLVNHHHNNTLQMRFIQGSILHIY
jgi:hypothetical protein